MVQHYDSSTDQDSSDGDDDDDAPIANPPPPPASNKVNRSKTTKANTSSRRGPLPSQTQQPKTKSATPARAATQRSRARNLRLSDTANNNGGGGGGASIPSYEDTAGPIQRSPSYFPPMPPTSNQPQHNNNNNNSNYFSRPRRPRTNTVPPNFDGTSTDYSSSSTSSTSNGPWQPLGGGGNATGVLVPLKRNKTVREPIGAPRVQAIVPRAPRNVAAAARLLEEEESDDDDDDEGVEGVVVSRGALPLGGQNSLPQQKKKLVAGGKKAALAVELKMNLEIELELKAYIHGDLTLELFN